MNDSHSSIHSSTLLKRMLQGGALALVLVLLFIYNDKNPYSDGSKLLLIRPIIVVTGAGALSGVFYYFMDHLRYQGGWMKVLAALLSILGFIVALWLGTVLGFRDTMWH